MEYVKSLIWKPSLDEQRRTCNALMRSELRGLDRSISNQIGAENKAKATIQAAHRRTVLFSSPSGKSKNPAYSSSTAAAAAPAGPPRNAIAAQAAQQEMRMMAKELIRLRRHTARLHTCRAQMASVQMQVNEAFAAKKIDSSMRASAKVMQAVNGMVSMPELMRAARTLSAELMKAGVIDEMVGDALESVEPVDEDELLGEDEEIEDEVQKVLQDILKLPPDVAPGVGVGVPGGGLEKDRVGAELELEFPDLPIPGSAKVLERPEGQPDGDDTREILQAMRGRLEALKS